MDDGKGVQGLAGEFDFGVNGTVASRDCGRGAGAALG
jgi:hypothetical protein